MTSSSAARNSNTNQMFYGTKDVEEITGISAFTIRYYDKCGFFPNLQRDKRGIRKFQTHDIERLEIVDALRKSGLSIDGIKYFTKLSRMSETNEANSEMINIINQQIIALEYQIAEAQESLQRLKNEQSRIVNQNDHRV